MIYHSADRFDLEAGFGPEIIGEVVDSGDRRGYFEALLKFSHVSEVGLTHHVLLVKSELFEGLPPGLVLGLIVIHLSDLLPHPVPFSHLPNRQPSLPENGVFIFDTIVILIHGDELLANYVEIAQHRGYL